ncbi:hypothetical protein ACFSCW_06690 [Sphingomonas tabacisoli]|uniref:Uncharacterized protein n=1 Tax=Sphingomonas tabacisoli TaxID=2249466 RepID=A0ABW4I1S9_9SPHN
MQIDDSDWRKEDLRHDWSIEDLPGGTDGLFTKAAIGKSGTVFTIGSEGWYLKHFRVEQSCGRADRSAVRLRTRAGRGLAQ